MADLTEAQQKALAKLSHTMGWTARELGVAEATLQVLVKKGLARDHMGKHFNNQRVYLKMAPVTETMPPEHQFAGVTVDQWEETVVRRAEYFTVSRSNHDGSCETSKHLSLVEAMEIASKDRRCLVAAVAPTGRFATLDRKKWDRFLEIYGEKKTV